MHCIFCEIVKGTIPSMKIYEDDNTLAFMDIADDVDGHMLVIPKKHIASIIDCDGDTLDLLMRTAKKVANHCVAHCGYDGVNLLNASAESAGQSVLHFHIHIIPRRQGDSIDFWPRFDGATCSREELYQRLRISITNKKLRILRSFLLVMIVW